MGPFSVKSYLECMLQDKVWGNMICCYLVASMWGSRLSVLNGDTCKETRIRHNLQLRDADFCLLFNSDVYNGHYSAICRDDQLLLITDKVTPKRAIERSWILNGKEGCRQRKWVLYKFAFFVSKTHYKIELIFFSHSTMVFHHI